MSGAYLRASGWSGPDRCGRPQAPAPAARYDGSVLPPAGGRLQMTRTDPQPSPERPAAVLTSATRLLVVERSPGQGEQVRALLAAGGDTPELMKAMDVADAVELVLRTPVDVVVMFEGEDQAVTLDELSEIEGVAPELPVVLLTADDGREFALSALRRGAQDVIARPGIEGKALSRAVRFAIERQSVDVEMTRRALHDALTGLPNRVLLNDRLAQGLGRLSRSEASLALLVLDLDGFKGVNDRYGHEAGDRLLVDVAKRLSSVLRTGDTAARFGGDEFVVLCEDVDSDHEVVAVAQRIAQALGDPFPVDGDELYVRASIGISIARGPGIRPEALLRDADSAMYRCKQRGVDYEVFDDVMRARATKRLGLEEELRRALDDGEFTLHYQPIFELTSGSIGACEALLRWAHPRRGVVLPGEFLDVAEDAGLTLGIGAWALGSAARQGALWGLDRPGGQPVTVAVNLSARQCQHEETIDAVAQAVERSGASAGALCLEFTEAAAVADVARVGRVLRGLKDLGVQLAIDDFGTGQSSLRMLEQLPVDIVKIDRSFTRGMSESREEAAIVAAVVGLAHALGLRTIAEGVETLAQVDRLRALGCDAAQGHYFAPAQPPADLTGLVVALA